MSIFWYQNFKVDVQIESMPLLYSNCHNIGQYVENCRKLHADNHPAGDKIHRPHAGKASLVEENVTHVYKAKNRANNYDLDEDSFTKVHGKKGRGANTITNPVLEGLHSSDLDDGLTCQQRVAEILMTPIGDSVPTNPVLGVGASTTGVENAVVNSSGEATLVVVHSLNLVGTHLDVEKNKEADILKTSLGD